MGGCVSTSPLQLSQSMPKETTTTRILSLRSQQIQSRLVLHTRLLLDLVWICIGYVRDPESSCVLDSRHPSPTQRRIGGWIEPPCHCGLTCHFCSAIYNCASLERRYTQHHCTNAAIPVTTQPSSSSTTRSSSRTRPYLDRSPNTIIEPWVCSIATRWCCGVCETTANNFCRRQFVSLHLLAHTTTTTLS